MRRLTVNRQKMVDRGKSMIWIVEKDGIVKKNKEDITVKEAGQKAYGLCKMPTLWTLPFFIIDKEFYLNVCEMNTDIINKYSDNILKTLQNIGMKEKVIIRSSGEFEGMDERGRYESVIVEKENVIQALIRLVEQLREYEELRKTGIPFVVQAYIERKVLGHLSNERRFSKEKRDFIYEYVDCEKKSVIPDKISLRNWRKTYDIENAVKEELIYNRDIKDVLKIVSAYYYYDLRRVHVEFVADNHRLYLVQCDHEVENKEGVNPEEYNISMEAVVNFAPQVLRKISAYDRGKYKKIDNVFIYQDIGEQTPPLYILDDRDTLEELKQGSVTRELRDDIKGLLKSSVVIRTNIISEEKRETQLSMRSNELRNYQETKKFLVHASKTFAQEGIDNYIFILHNFIPAQIAAFVNAKPMEQTVEIQALWGLPEGLYYNAHDRITIFTKTNDVERMNKEKFEIILEPVFKEKFIAPDEKGEWVVKKLRPPYDWRITITDIDMIKDIAYRARKITEHVGTELSIMWFIGIDESYYKTSNMPWYHEKCDRNSFYDTKTSERYRKKYFYEKEYVIQNEEDLKKLEHMNLAEVGIVRIQPNDDKTLRSKEFIKNVGTFCSQNNINIFLEGSVLAHTYYQLLNTGANVICAHEMKEKQDKIEYNKLVRDNIPQIIRENGEKVVCVCIKKEGLICELKNKIVEEAYEVFEAEEDTEIIEELADLAEVCEALESKLFLLNENKQIIDNVVEGNIFKFQIDINEQFKQQKAEVLDGENWTITLERKKSLIQLDLIVGDKKEREIKEEISQPDNEKREILEYSFELLKTNDKKKNQELLKNIKKITEEILKKIHCNKSDYMDIKEKKKLKKGAFEKGYVLLKTSANQHLEEGLKTIDFIGDPKDIYELSHPIKTDIDELRDDRMLIRLKIPAFTTQTQVWLTQEKVINRLGGKVRIQISIKQTTIILAISVIRDEYKQLELDWDNEM